MPGNAVLVGIPRSASGSRRARETATRLATAPGVGPIPGATLGAVRANPRLRAFHRRPRQAGKPARSLPPTRSGVAPVAAMHKLPAHLDAMPRHGQDRAEKPHASHGLTAGVEFHAASSVTGHPWMPWTSASLPGLLASRAVARSRRSSHNRQSS